MAKDLTILSVQSIYDKETYEKPNASQYEVPIQAGAILTRQRIAELTDCTGDHISYMNRRYSELTAMYWAWKNLDCDYIGLCHYRRKFDVSDDFLKESIQNKADMIILKPITLEKTIDEMYFTYHYIYDWIYVLELVHEKNPDFYDFINLKEHRILHPACMAIYRREIFDETCRFLFPILEKFCQDRPEKRDIYQRRDAGFLGERLLSLYFEYRKEKLSYIEVPMRAIASEYFLDANGEPQKISDTAHQLIKDSNWTKCSSVICNASDNDHKTETLKKLTSVYFAERENEKETFFDYLPRESDLDKLVEFYDEAAANILMWTSEHGNRQHVQKWIEKVNITPTAIKEVAKLELKI